MLKAAEKNETRWQKIVAREPDESFFFGVRTTGVFCRPGCSARTPKRENVVYFDSVESALKENFRACKRCKPTETAHDAAVEKMRKMIESSVDENLSLEKLAQAVTLTATSAQKKFKAVMGVSPREYQSALRARRLRVELKKGVDVTESIYAAGYGGASRVYEGTNLGMTPARFKAGGRGEQIGYATAKTKFGWMIVATTARGLCWLALSDTERDAIAGLREEFSAAELKPVSEVAEWIEQAVASVEGKKLRADLPLDLRGTAFQLRVWSELKKIPRGQTLSYSGLARQMGEPNSTRAVARACATNRVALLVPCHRIVGADGSLTGYRWGVERKQQLLRDEGAQL